MTAIVVGHDYLTQRGGAERVALAMASALPGASVLTTLYEPDRTFPEFSRLHVETSGLQHLPWLRRHFRAGLPLYPAAIRSMGPVDARVLVSSSTAFAHGIESQGCHISYIHSPPHWLWDTGRYTGERSLQRLAVQPLRRVFQRLDVAAAQRPHLLLTNSANSARKIHATYGRHAEVLPPPVRSRPSSPTRDDHFLVVSRLLPYKRVDLAVAAATRLGRRLVVVGDGPERGRLEAMAGPAVEFRQHVPDAELDELYARCQAVVVPGEEDLGLVAVEAASAGRPTVATAAGGSLETVVDGRTGLLVSRPDAENLAAAMQEATRRPWDPQELQRHAAQWSEESFARGLRLLVEAFPGWCRQCGGIGLGPEPLRRLLELESLGPAVAS